MTYPPCITCCARFALLVSVLATGLAAAAPPPPRLVVTPAEALEKMARIDGRNPPLTKDEAGLFKDVKDGKFDEYSFIEACLIAGGVNDSRDRDQYVVRLDWLEADLRKATAGSKTSAEDATRLLKFLHAGPMAKGYKAEQSDLHVLLDSGHFNCVSSAVLFTVMARRLGINVRAMEMPGHVFSVLITRDRRIDVETTSPDGFDVDPRRQFGPAKVDRSVGKRREIGDRGLAALVAYNHGIVFAQKKRFADSLRANFLALGLDPSNRKAESNAVADLVNWPLELAKAGKYEQAMVVLAVGTELIPKEPALVQNTLAVYDAWADAYIKRKDWAAAVRVYEQALEKFPDDKHVTNNLAYSRQQLQK